MKDKEKSDAAYYAMYLRSLGLTPEQAAKHLVKAYPGTRPELEQRGLIQPSLFCEDDDDPPATFERDAGAFDPK